MTDLLNELRFAGFMLAGAGDEAAQAEALERFDELVDAVEAVTIEPDHSHALNVLRNVGAID